MKVTTKIDAYRSKRYSNEEMRDYADSLEEQGCDWIMEAETYADGHGRLGIYLSDEDRDVHLSFSAKTYIHIQRGKFNPKCNCGNAACKHGKEVW
jgi:hypothetical protein